MSRLRPIEARRLIRFLVQHGFHVVGQTGSHVKLKRADGTSIVVPAHARHPVKAGLVLKILKRAGLDAHRAMEDL